VVHVWIRRNRFPKAFYQRNYAGAAVYEISQEKYAQMVNILLGGWSDEAN